MLKNPLTPICLAMTVWFTGSTAARAECGGVRCVDQIERIYVSSTFDGVKISTSGDETELDCVPEEGIYIQLDKSNGQFKEIYSMLLAVKLAGRPVNLRISPSPGSVCKLRYVMFE